MDSISAYFPIFDDLPTLKQTLPKVLDYGIENIIIRDGRFYGFESDHDNSNDGLEEYLKQFKSIDYKKMGPCYEEDKLNSAFHTKSKFVLLLGADEWPTGDISRLRKYLGRFDGYFEPERVVIPIKTYRPEKKWNRPETRSPKLFVNPMFTRARHTHWLYYSCGKLNYNYQYEIFDPEVILVHHDDDLREKSRDDKMTKFQDWNVQREQPLAGSAKE